MLTGRRVRDSGLLPASVEAAKVVQDARERAMTSQDSGHQIVAQSSVGTSAAIAAKLPQASSWKRSLRRVKACPHCRRKVRQSPNFTVVSTFSATVALFCDSVDRALGRLQNLGYRLRSLAAKCRFRQKRLCGLTVKNF